MCQYKCIDNDSGFMSGHIYDLGDINNGYYILNGEGNTNVYIKEELDKWFKKIDIKVVDVNHGEKFNLLHNKLKEQTSELPPCYKDNNEIWLNYFKQDCEMFKNIMELKSDDYDLKLLFIEKNIWKTKEFNMLKDNTDTTDFSLILTKILELADKYNIEIR